MAIYQIEINERMAFGKCLVEFLRYYTSKSCKDDKCITVSATYGKTVGAAYGKTVSATYGKTVGAAYGKKIISSLQDFVIWYMPLTVSVAYGYVHSTPAALKFAGEFTDNYIKSYQQMILAKKLRFSKLNTDETLSLP